MRVCQSLDRPFHEQRAFAKHGITDNALSAEGHKPLAVVLLDMVRRLGFGTIAIDQYGYVTDINPIGRDLLEAHGGVNRGLPEAEWLRGSVRRLLDKAAPYSSSGTEWWVTIPTETDRPLALQLIPVQDGDGLYGGFMMILVDLDRHLQPNHTTLSSLFGLTAAEARLATQIARGTTAVSMANRNRLSVATIRTQLASIFRKTNTRRQSELALLLTRAAVLP